MLMAALEAEVTEYIERFAVVRDADGRRLVVRNGQARERTVTCGAGTWQVRAPRVNDKRVDGDGARERFTSRILPPYMRRSPQVAEVLPLLYLRGLSTGDFREALPALFLGGHPKPASMTSWTYCRAFLDRRRGGERPASNETSHRAGELRIDWTEPLLRRSAMGVASSGVTDGMPATGSYVEVTGPRWSVRTATKAFPQPW